MAWGDPKPEQKNVNGKVVWQIKCNLDKCKSVAFEESTESKVKAEFRKHKKYHERYKAAKKAADLGKKAKSRVSGKGKCDDCGKKPCSLTKRVCVEREMGKVSKITGRAFPSTMDVDVTDPATYDPQLKDWFK